MGKKLEQLVKNLIREGSREPTKKQVDAAMDLLKTLVRGTRFAGKVFVAGGAVRDMVMGKDPTDIDLVVEMEEGGLVFARFLARQLGIYKSGSNPVEFPRFGTAKVAFDGVVHNGVPLDGVDIEVVATREEEYEAGSRKPTTRYGTIKQDVLRRDFTINTLLLDILSGKIVDLTGKGKEDIAKGVIRTPSEPDRIFMDDPLRLLRAVRFAGRYRYRIPRFMKESIIKNAYMLRNISSERIREELEKILRGQNPDRGIALLYRLRLMRYVIPQLIGKSQDAMSGARKGHGFIGKLILMLKNVPAEEIHNIRRHLKFSNETTDIIYNVVKAMQDIEEDNSDPSILKIGSELVSKGYGKYIELLEPLDKQVVRLKPYFHKGPVIHFPPRELMRTFNIKPGPKVGKLMQLQKDIWYENPEITKEEAEGKIFKELESYEQQRL